VKGWFGSGTEADPLQVTCIEDLLELAEPHIGQKDYYFVQTADIDGSQVSTWHDIVFQGHYDGQGFTILPKNGEWLFSAVQPNSTLNNMKINNGMLAKILKNSTVTNCESNIDLLGNVNDSKITNCSAGDNLIYFNQREAQLPFGSLVSNCIVTACSAGNSLIRNDISGIEKCTIINSKSNDNLIFSSGDVDGCSILDCSGCNYLILLSKEYYKFLDTIVQKSFCADKLASDCYGHNCLITSISDSACLNGFQANGKTLDAAQWKQRYFENTMGWDFDNVWVWNDAENRPELRYVGVGSAQPQAKPQNPQEGMEDLLGVELRENIWL
jgi:MoxR-like ATPase